jgi:hypothetical protein
VSLPATTGNCRGGRKPSPMWWAFCLPLGLIKVTRQNDMKIVKGIWVAILLVIIFATTWYSFTADTGPSVNHESTSNTKSYSDVEAFVEAEHIVSGFLKAPSTAQFPSMSDATIEDLADNGFKVSSYVDSQNSFGAMLRSSWSVLFEYTPDDKVDIYQVIVDGEEMYRKPGLK